MTNNRQWMMVASLLAATCAANAMGQAPTGYSQQWAPAANGVGARGSYQRVSGSDNPAIRFYGGNKALSYVTRNSSAAMPLPRPVNTAPMAKPFNNLHQGSNITPYLGLDMAESGVGFPNYFAYVQPRLQQQEVNQVQQLQYQRLQQQLRVATAGAAISASTSGGIPTTGHGTQFMNPAGYYPAAR